MSQPVFNPKPGKIVASSDLRQNMSKQFDDLNTTKGAVVITVANKPRVVLSDFATYSELLYQAKR